MAIKLNQVIAVEKGTKSRSLAELTEAHHALQKPALLAGISRTYEPKAEDGESFPPESTKVQIRAEEILKKTAEIQTKLFDVIATKDWSNLKARADVVVAKCFQVFLEAQSTLGSQILSSLQNLSRRDVLRMHEQ